MKNILHLLTIIKIQILPDPLVFEWAIFVQKTVWFCKLIKCPSQTFGLRFLIQAMAHHLFKKSSGLGIFFANGIWNYPFLSNVIQIKIMNLNYQLIKIPLSKFGP